MKDIFAELYNKVLSFFNKTDEKAENAKDVACNRLKLVLMQDRTNLTPAIMDRMRKELIELLSKYMELDRELLDLNFEHEDEQMALMLSIPVIRAKNEDEIQEILDREDEERKKLNELLGNEEDSDDEEYEDDDDEEDDGLSEEEDDNESESDSIKSKKEQKKEKFFKEKKRNGAKNNEDKEQPVEEPTDDTVDGCENKTEAEEKSEPAEEINENEENEESAEGETTEANESV